MARFKQVTEAFISRKLVEFWGNMVKNYTGDVSDCDFFEILCDHYEHDKAVELVEKAYSAKQLKEMMGGRRRSRVDFDDSLDELFSALWNHAKSRRKCRSVLNAMKADMLADLAKRGDETFERRFLELKRVLKLSDLEFGILLIAYVRRKTCFNWPKRVECRDLPLYYAMALDRSYDEVMRAMTAKGALRRFELLDDDWRYNGNMLDGYIGGSDDEPIERRFYRKNEEAEVLPWDFYGELAARDGAVLRSLLGSGLGKCNILLYGAPGTGKTSFARTLAREVGRTAWEIKQGDDDGKNMQSEARLVGIQVCNEQEDPSSSLMIVDEADALLRGNFSIFDLLFGGGRGGKSTEKGVVNTILDGMKMPAIWISNAPASQMDESVRRRFDYSIRFEALNTAQRISIWRNVVRKLSLGKLVSEAQIADYAATYATSAGGISMVLNNIKGLAPRKSQVDDLVATLMKPHCQLMGVKGTNLFLPDRGYSLEGLNVKGQVRLEQAVGAVRNYLDASFNARSVDRPRMNLLMFGPPGTGKTEFVKYLGQTLDRKVLVVKGSDLLSKYVGESEQNIAMAFRRAESEHAILFFDEIDGLVQDRAHARASWEVAQVNELLQQMENFDGVMVAATNFCSNLDPAIMRRFTFKFEFDYLDDAGKKLFFERMFDTRLTESELADLSTLRNLAPGDFRTVRQKTFYLDAAQTNTDRIAALREECLLKRDGEQRTSIGFAA